MPKKKLSLRQKAVAAGYRSGLEERVAAELQTAGIDVRYEEDLIRFIKPARKSRYTPDFVLPNGIIIETKGRFVTADRQKHILIKQQHPDLDIRFVFSNPNTRISKTSATTYAMWCDKHGFDYAKGSIPEAWLEEALDTLKIEALTKAGIS
jgi:hypothetical protein